MKKLLKTIIISILSWEARLIVRKHRPKIVGVTGSVGKTSTKETIAAVLAEGTGVVRKSEKSYNSEFGVPLTIIGCHTAWSNPFGWIYNILKGLNVIIFDNEYPDWLVLEIGADRPGDIKKIVKWLPIDVAVITRLPEIPVHVEFFRSKEQVIEEKMSLAWAVKETGKVFINIDDENVAKFIDQKIVAPITYYGIEQSCPVRGSHMKISYRLIGDHKLPIGMSFQIDYDDKALPVLIKGTLGRHLMYPFLAGFAVGVEEGINPIAAVDALSAHDTPPGRMHLIDGKDNTLIIDDTYNASPAAMEAGLRTLGEVETSGSRIAVLGDMMELGTRSTEAHRAIGQLSAKTVDFLITVGVRAKFIGDTAVEAGFPTGQWRHCDNSEEAGELLSHLIKAHDVIYLKGSQSMRMEKAVKKIMLQPERSAELLVRQDPEWKKR